MSQPSGELTGAIGAAFDSVSIGIERDAIATAGITGCPGGSAAAGGLDEAGTGSFLIEAGFIR